MMGYFMAADIDMITIPVLVWTVYIGVAVGIFMTYYNKAVLGRAIRALIEKEAIGKDKALSAEALGFEKNRFILNSIRRGVLSRFVHSDESEGSQPRYYLDEEDRVRAELRYTNKGTDLYVVILSLVIFTIVAFIFARYLPEWIRAAGDIIS